MTICANNRYTVRIECDYPLVVHPGGVGPLRNIMKSSVPRLLNPNCKNEIWGVQPHMLRKEKIISHPTEGFAKIKMRFQK